MTDTPKIPAGVVALSDYETLAAERLPAAIWAYLAGGAGDESTVRANLEGFARRTILPRVLRDLSGATTALSLLGDAFAHPVFIAPMAFHRLFHDEGELAAVMAAAALEAGMVVSTQASHTLEDIAARAKSPLWFQLYMHKDRAITLELVRRAEAAGYRAVVVTVDAPFSGLRNREQRHGFQLPRDISAVNLAHLPRPLPEDRVFGSALAANAPTWDDLAWLQAETRLPVLLKGILSPQDATLALAQGIDGLIVSNHGGRVLDSVPATIDALPAVVAAVDGRVPVLVDGGIRRGTDVFKAIACGADAVMVGRPVLWGLAVAGAVGAAHVLKILRTELEIAMALTGCRTLAEIRASGMS